MCDPLQTSAKEKHCLENGPADWFIVLDVSWFNESNKLQNLATTKSTFEKQTLLTDQLITFLSKTERARPRKNRMSILLATGQMVHIVRRLCDEKPLENSRPKLRALPNVRPSNNQILLDEVFDDIDKQSSICNEQFSSTKQRIVLYIAQNAPDEDKYFAKARTILMKWHNEYENDRRRSTQVYFIVLSRSRTNGFNSKYFDSFHVRGELFLNPKSEAYDKLESTLGERIVSCACLWSEDCGTSNSSMAVPCHFEGDYKEEQCTATIYRTVTFRGENVRLPTTDLEGCHPVIFVHCNFSECLKDCDEKGWSEWSVCANFLQKRNRLNESAGHSQFTTSCQKEEQRRCILGIPLSESNETGRSASNSVLILALIFVILIFPGAIIALVAVVASNKQRARRRSVMLRCGSLHGFDPIKRQPADGLTFKEAAVIFKWPTSFLPLKSIFDKQPQRPPPTRPARKRSRRRNAISSPSKNRSGSGSSGPSGTTDRFIHVNMSAREHLPSEGSKNKKRESS